jgi:hypothetical protein
VERQDLGQGENGADENEIALLRTFDDGPDGRTELGMAFDEVEERSRIDREAADSVQGRQERPSRSAGPLPAQLSWFLAYRRCTPAKVALLATQPVEVQDPAGDVG